jgi:competence protein ComEC
VVLYAFGQLSLVSLLTNFLILPAQPGVMMCGGMATLLGLVWLPLGQAVGLVAWLFLTYTVRIVEIMARIPFAAIDIQRPSLVVIWLYYGLLLGWLAWKTDWLKSIGLVKPGNSG